MAYPLTVSLVLGAANSGLTLTPALHNADGTSAAGLTTTDLLEVAAGSGSYEWTGTLPDGHRGYIRFLDGATFKAHVGIEPAEVETAAAVWAYASRTLTTAIAAVSPPPVISGDLITIIQADTMVLNFTGLGALTGRSKLWFSVKDSVDDEDSEAVIFIEESAGLVTLNGAAGTSGQGGITVTDAGTGAITVTLDEAAAAQLTLKRGRAYSVKSLISGVATTHTRGTADVSWTAAKATS